MVSRRVTRAWAGLFALAVSMAWPLAQAEQLPPTEAAALFEWLKDGRYRSWSSESEPHTSLGPHPVKVVAYLNATLEASMAAKQSVHPKGSAALKELFDSKGALAGWAVAVKTADDSAGGKGWYWYEILGTSRDSRVVADGNGVPLCFGCHATGKDFVLINFPLK